MLRLGHTLLIDILDDKSSNDELLQGYRIVLYGKGVASKGTLGKNRSRIKPARTERAMANGRKGKKLPLWDVLRTRVRYFTAGTAIGSDDFLSNIDGQWTDRYGLERKRNAYSMRYAYWGGLRSTRNLQVDPIELPSLN